MPSTAPRNSSAQIELVPADGYAAMFEDAPAPTAEDLRDLHDLLPFEQFERSPDLPAERTAPETRRLRIAAA